MLASASKDRTVILWEITKGRPVRMLQGHRSAVCAVAFSPDGKLVASGSTDNTIKLWDVATGAPTVAFPKSTLVGHTDSVLDLAFSPDGRLLISGSSDRTVRVWKMTEDMKSQRLDAPHDEVVQVTFSPQGETFASISKNGRLYLWNSAAASLARSFKDHASWKGSFLFSPDGKHFASIDAQRRTATVRDTTTMDVKFNFKSGPGDSDQVSSLAISPNGILLALGLRGQIRIYHIDTGQLLLVLRFQIQGSVVELSFSPDGKMLASAVLASATGHYDIHVWQHVAPTRQRMPLRQKEA